ncbi:MAG: hypothetical protein FWB78_01160 [Treponema sp.]|nr:hypothetical protein [Treponema sp.]
MKQGQKSLVSKKVSFLALATLIIATACASIDTRAEKSTGQIFLYGEAHGVERIMNRQLEIWYEYYHNWNMRHMFIEVGFFTAEFLNMWMQAGNDDILYELFDDWAGTSMHVPYTLAFFRTIKREFPETIFHGVDVGHQFWSTGERFLRYLRDNNMQGTERYLLTLEAIEQGKNFYRFDDFELWYNTETSIADFDLEYRVTSMANNFIREFDRLGNQSVMGIFGNAHVTIGYGPLGLPHVPTLAQRLRERYGDSVHTTDLAWLTLPTDPIRVDTISINGVDYEASYFGTDSAAFGDIVSSSFWRLENAYDDFSDKPTNGDMLPLDNYPMRVEMHQVFVVDVTFTDGTVLRLFYRSDGEYWYGRPITTGFSVD